MNPLECIAFIVINGDEVLAEKRKLTKKGVPGAVTLPGGHLEDGESPEDALHRELREELGIIPRNTTYVCTLLHRSQEFRKLHYFAIHGWKGDILNNEAEALLWIRFDELGAFDLDVDRIAISEYRRVYPSELESGSDTDEKLETVNEPFKPGDKVTWCKRIPGGDYVYPVQATVLALTAKRVKIEADDDGDIVIRYVPQQSLLRQELPPYTSS